MENKQTKQFEISVIKASASGQTGTVQLLGNVFGLFDGYDILLPGSTKKSIAEQKPIILDGHNSGSSEHVIAGCDEAIEVDRNWLVANAPHIIEKYDHLGLKGKGITGAMLLTVTFDMSISKSAEIYKRLANKWLSGCSIGFTSISAKTQQVTLNNGEVVTARLISLAKIWEVSIVPFQQNIASQVISVRANNNSKREKGLQEINALIADLDKQAAVKNINRLERIREIGLMEIEMLLQELENA